MLNIQSIEDADDRIHDIITESYQDLIGLMLKSEFPKTAKFFIGSLNRTNFIKNSIFDLASTADLYSVNILYRSLIEHYLVFQYIYTKFIIERTDESGIMYYTHLDMKENIDYVKSLNQVREIFYDEQPLDSIEELKKVDDRFKSITKKEIDTIAKDFQFKNIIKYLTQHIPNTNGNGFLSEIIPAYSELSSYVHGGPFAEHEFIKFANESEREKYLLNVCGMAFLISKAIKEFVYIFGGSLDKTYLPFGLKIKMVTLPK